MTELPIILLGLGGVGRALLQQVLKNRAFHRYQYGLQIRFLALCDSRGALLEPGEGFSDTQLNEILHLKEQGGSLTTHPLGGTQGDLAAIVDIAGRPGTVVIDCTASDATVPALFFALDRGYPLVLANKKPLTMGQDVYDRLTRAGASRAPAQARWETTVGAGLPVVATLNRLVSSGDTINRISGTFSGTLGYLMTGLEEGRSFSETVQEAFRLGYTEPDPRDDLGGVDVARKALILARGMGWHMEMKQVEVNGLYPETLADLSVDTFLAKLPSLDEHYRKEVAQAATEGKVLRYAASVEWDAATSQPDALVVSSTQGTCRSGLTAVPKDSPLGRLRGTDNLVELYSRWYSPNPLVIQGRGAGVEATAAGVLSDVMELGFSAGLPRVGRL